MRKLLSRVAFSLLAILVLPGAAANAAIQKNTECASGANLSAQTKTGLRCLNSNQNDKHIYQSIDIRAGKSIRTASKVTQQPSSTSACKIKTFGVADVTTFGFPKSKLSRPSLGSLKGLMVFVDFEDIKGTDDPILVGHKFTDRFQKFYEAQSYGRLKINMQIHPDYLHIPARSDSYGMDKWNEGLPSLYWNDGLSAAKEVLDITQFDFVVVMPPNKVSKIVFGPAFPGTQPAVEGRFKRHFSGVVGGSDQRDKADETGWIWLSHEMGHNFGFEHQYGFYPQPVWDLMDNVYIETAPELFAWSRFIQGWLSNSQVICLTAKISPSGTYETRLSAIEMQDQSKKALFIKISQHQILGLEFRSSLGFDLIPESQIGVLPYIVTPDSGSNDRAIDPLFSEGLRDANGQLYGTLGQGVKFKTHGYLIWVKSLDHYGANVSVTKL